MPEFTPDDIDIDPSEFVGACNQKEIKELITALVEHGHIDSKAVLYKDFDYDGGYGRTYVNDLNYIDNLESLKSKRHLLTTTEEDYINNLSKRFQHI